MHVQLQQKQEGRKASSLLQKNNDAAASPASKEARRQQQQPSPSLDDLPAEIHLLISKQLIYPDALSLKHTSRYFYSLVDTGIKLKVAWLMERRSLHLECPNDRRCDLGSDLKFCRGSVRLLMQRRREHMECESRPGLGCLVYGTHTCLHRPQLRSRWAKWLRAQFTIEAWWVLLALMPIFLGWFYIVDLLR
ncbi:hypothetical protein PFICI_04743 [Pestalotiopsis fici W106-1]|uniref:F-box domain-containing protein n=1 Tax=Pestalotiopsis fici (strain W106-1 / CGMCC3.15140) TaxID=1229662 RepID=W3XBR4_PESFW|nr:uncharacterized protein PFICI_04743 [Pestalotiopsis fici W106-1]ETS82867.1 hypothetical protein PFICI_04743 [Pestalotiopsis fici W106-1]